MASPVPADKVSAANEVLSAGLATISAAGAEVPPARRRLRDALVAMLDCTTEEAGRLMQDTGNLARGSFLTDASFAYHLSGQILTLHRQNLAAGRPFDYRGPSMSGGYPINPGSRS